MAEQDKPTSGRKAPGKLDASDFQPGERPQRATWNSTAELDRGGVSANDTARPRDTEAVSGEEKTTVGFTNTSPTGSAGGRALYGTEPDAEREGMKDETEEA